MATKAGTLRRAGDGKAAVRLPAVTPGGSARARVVAAVARAAGKARQRHGLDDARGLAEIGRATGARC